MTLFSSEELGRIVNLAENGSAGADERLKKRLSQNRRPTTRDATDNWVNWGSMQSYLGQPFDTTKIPLDKLDQMRRDPMIAFGLAFTVIPAIRATWYIKSEDAQRAAFIDNALRIIYARYILGRSNSYAFGFSPGAKRFEYSNPDWTYVDSRNADYTPKNVWPEKSVQALIWKPFVWLDPRQCTPHFNSSGDYAGIDYTPTSRMGAFFQTGNSVTGRFAGGDNRAADIPLDWALWATNDKDSVFGSLYGYPLIGHAYRYWWSYWYKFGLSDRAFEKWADPPIIVYHPNEVGLDADGQQVDFGDVALSIAEQLRSGANAAMPSSVVTSLDLRQTGVREWDIRQLETEAQFDALIQSFEYLDVLKLRACLIPEQSLIEGKGASSSRNVAEIYGDLLTKGQAARMEEIDAEINRFLIPQLLEANFGPGGATCTKVTTGFDPKDVETMRAIVGAIANKNGDIPEVDTKRLLEYLGVPTLTNEAINAKIDEIVKRQEKFAPPEVNGIPGKQAGVNNLGLYEQPRDVIELSASKEESESFWKKVAQKFSKDEREREERDEQRDEQILTTLSETATQIKRLAEKDPNIHLDVVLPEIKQEEPNINLEVVVPKQKERKGVRKLINRNKQGDIVSVEEHEIEE